MNSTKYASAMVVSGAQSSPTMDAAGAPKSKRRRNTSGRISSKASFYDDVDDDGASIAAPSSLASDDDDGDAQHYQAKRRRNNAAVRKSRERSKAKANDAQSHLQQLRRENRQLEHREKSLTRELTMLKESFLKQMMEHVDGSRAYAAAVFAASAAANCVDDDGRGDLGVDDINNNDNNFVVLAPEHPPPLPRGGKAILPEFTKLEESEALVSIRGAGADAVGRSVVPSVRHQFANLSETAAGSSEAPLALSPPPPPSGNWDRVVVRGVIDLKREKELRKNKIAVL